jgi:3-dehydroquinate synthase
MSRVLFEDNSFTSLSSFFTANSFSSVYVLADENTVKHCYPKVLSLLPQHRIIQIPSGEENKTINTCNLIWQKLTEANADRKALLINLGGGVIGDMGGFAAGCYKRGIAFINIPTTLLAMVDASVGAKCGIDFMGFKNQIGLFNEPESVFIYTGFLETLPERELRSGFAEVVKHYLIADKEAFNKIKEQRLKIKDFDFDALVKKNVAIKQQIVEQDPTEQNIRKALNFGHTIGHAMESFFLNDEYQKLLHGEAVAIGMICESYVSFKKELLSQSELQQITEVILHYFGKAGIAPQHFDQIAGLIQQDKKNEQAQTRFTLLNGIGSYTINRAVEKEWIRESLVYFNSLPV